MGQTLADSQVPESECHGTLFIAPSDAFLTMHLTSFRRFPALQQLHNRNTMGIIYTHEYIQIYIVRNPMQGDR